jgi:nucleoside-diphosphate-sugar epimerase
LHILLTGAAGFIGRGLTERLLAPHGTQGFCDRLTLLDPDIASLPVPAPATEHIFRIEGSISDPAMRARALALGPDCIVHLAAIPGGAAERDYDVGWELNALASMALALEAAQARCTKFVYASTIAVFGALAGAVDDETMPFPATSYGAHKLMVETLLTDLARRDMLDARSIRLPGIVARPRQRTGHGSAFMSDIFHALSAGEHFVSPVSAAASFWLMSRPACIDNLLHAVHMPADALPLARAWTLPALHVTMAELAAEIGASAGKDDGRLVHYAPVREVEDVFGHYPVLRTPRAESLGFRHDGSLAALVRRTLADARA